MSTVAYDGRYLASDTMGAVGDYRQPNHIDKLVTRNGRAFAVVGSIAYFGPMVEWITMHSAEARLYPGKADWGSVITVGPHSEPEIYSDDIPYPQRSAPLEALGAGREFALGAMLAGLTAPEAVAIAIQANYRSGGVVRFVDLHRSPLEVQEFDPVPWLAIRTAYGARRPMPDLLNMPRLADGRGELARVIERPNPPAGIWGMNCRADLKPDEYGMGCGICKSCADRFVELARLATPDELQYEHRPPSEHDLGRRRLVAIVITPRFRAAVRGRPEGAAAGAALFTLETLAECQEKARQQAVKLTIVDREAMERTVRALGGEPKDLLSPEV